MNSGITQVGRLYAGTDDLYEVVETCVGGWQYTLESVRSGERRITTGLEMARMTRFVPKAIAALEALWEAPAARASAPRLTGTKAQQSETGA